MESKDNQWMIIDSLCQSYGPFDSYDKAREELIKRDWRSVSVLDRSSYLWDFLYYLFKMQDNKCSILYAKIVPLKEIKSVDQIPSRFTS